MFNLQSYQLLQPAPASDPVLFALRQISAQLSSFSTNPAFVNPMEANSGYDQRMLAICTRDVLLRLDFDWKIRDIEDNPPGYSATEGEVEALIGAIVAEHFRLARFGHPTRFDNYPAAFRGCSSTGRATAQLRLRVVLRSCDMADGSDEEKVLDRSGV